MIQTVEKLYDYQGNFISYRITTTSNEQISVPLNPENTDYQTILEWQKIDGNEIIDNGGGE